MKFQELVLWATVGALLSAVGYNWDTWQFWCFLGTYWAMGQLGKAVGRVEGIIDFIDMTDDDQKRIRKALDDARGESND